MKKLLFCLLLVSNSLFSEEFEEIYKEQIKEIIIREEKKYPNDYYMQSLMIKSEISKLKEVETLKKKYGVK